MVAPGLVTHTDPPTHSLTAWILLHCVSLHASVYCETCLSLGLTQATREGIQRKLAVDVVNKFGIP